MNIPERLNPPPDDWIECPDCDGSGASAVAHVLDRYNYCPRCHGDGVVSKAEERRELEAAIGDREYDTAQDRKEEEEEK